MGKTIEHRGPDNFSTLISGNAGFAHNRLSIIDPTEAGNQPFANERYVLTYNGEIYNYLDLKRALVEQGVFFRSTSDTEVLFHSLIRNGVEATIKSIDGMFAFAFYDKREGTIVLCRDRLGIKPLYWTHRAGSLFYGSEIKAIAAAVPVEADSIRALYSLSLRPEIRRTTSLFRNVNSLEPGTYLKFKPSDSPKIIRYFSLVDLVDENHHRELGRLNLQTAQEMFLERMKESVRSMLMGDVPMGVFVSGGVDSSLVAALVKDAGSNVNLFTANILGKLSEFGSAQALARSIDLPLSDYRFSPEMLVRDLVHVTWHNESPVIHNHEAAALMNVARLARSEGVKPVLTGEGADELFLGYSWMSRQWLKAKFPGLTGILQKLIGRSKQARHEQREFIESLIEEGCEQRKFQAEASAALESFSAEDAKLSSTTLDVLRTNVYALLHRNDRMGMTASIESRFPFLDEELIRFGVNLPTKWKIRWTASLHDKRHPFLKDKFILRKAAERCLPPRLARNPKNPFPTYGPRFFQVRRGFFKDGYVSELLSLNRAVADATLDESQSVHTGKLVSLEVFGRLFARRESEDDVDSHVQRFVSMK